MHHFDEMPGAFLADPIAARSSILNFGRDGLIDFFHMGPGIRIASRHDRRTETRLLLSRNTCPYEVDAIPLQSSCPAICIAKQRVTTVDDDVAFLEIRKQACNH